MNLKKTVLLLLWPLLSPWAAASESENTIQNLKTFCTLYGYVKYFHPSDEASEIDWDAFAIYGVRQIKGSKNRQELLASLKSLFLPIAPTMQLHETGEEPQARQPITSGNKQDLLQVAWQHKGIGLGNPGPYLSARTNRSSTAPKQSFGTIAQSLDATPYRGKTIKLEAFVRADVENMVSGCHLWLRVDRPKNARGFFDNMGDRPIRSSEWQKYEIIGTVASDAQNIAFGGFLTGSGSGQFDTFALLEKDANGRWLPITIANPEFENGSTPKGWNASSPGYDYQIIQNKAWAGKNTLKIQNQPSPIVSRLFNSLPKDSEVIRKSLGGGISCVIPLTLYSDQKRTLGPTDNYPLEPLRTALEAIAASPMSAKDISMRLGNVVIAWNVFQHFYPYFDVVNSQWHKVLDETLKQAMTDRDETDFYHTLKTMLVPLRDGHGRAFHPNIEAKMAGFAFSVDWIENQMVVIYSQDEKVQRGDLILTIDGIAAEQILADAESKVSGSTQWRRHAALQREFGRGQLGSSSPIKVSRAGVIQEVTVTRSSQYPPVEKKGGAIQKHPNGIYYVDLRRAKMPAIKAELEALAAAPGIIFDLRGYPVGNHEILQHLTDKPIQSAIWNVPEIIYPDQENIAGWNTSGRWHLPAKSPRFRGHFVFLTNGTAISYAESVLGIVEAYQLGDIVGQPTAGANGNVNPLRLPGGFNIYWTGMKVVKHDGSQHHLIGVQPTHELTPTLKAIREDRDEYIEKATALIMEKLP